MKTRTIKFRAWDKKEKRIRLVAMLDTDEEGKSMFTAQYYGEGDYTYKKNIELMQFTGLKDKNGKEIYEGDIITCNGGYETTEGSSGECECPRVVEFLEDTLQFVALCKDCNSSVPLYEFDLNEVIGDIYSSPELLN